MKKLKITKISVYIPSEIQEEILKRLPVKPLVQFRSVSKPWKGLIDSPDFIVSYGVRHPHPDRFILRYKLSSLNSVNDRYITLVDNDDSLVQQDFIPNIPDLIKKFVPRTIEVVGSSHGLLCVKGCYEYGQRIEMAVIWNPSLRKSIGIQVPHIYHDLPRCNAGLNVDYGFGVCPATLDPTFLEIKCIEKMEDMHVSCFPWKVRVFTLSTGAWSILSTNLPCESIRLRGSQVVIDRFIYWVAYDLLDAVYGRSQSHQLIVSFDLTTKEFKEINLTDSLANQLCKIHTISKLRESLVLLEYHTEFEEDVSVRCCCLWMMKEQGDSRSFTKLYNINLLPDVTINKILGFRNIGELILEIRGETRPEFELDQCAEVQIYNPNSKAIDNLLIDGVKYLFFMCPYMETLLLLDQLDGSTYSCFCLSN